MNWFEKKLAIVDFENDQTNRKVRLIQSKIDNLYETKNTLKKQVREQECLVNTTKDVLDDLFEQALIVHHIADDVLYVVLPLSRYGRGFGMANEFALCGRTKKEEFGAAMSFLGITRVMIDFQCPGADPVQLLNSNHCEDIARARAYKSSSDFEIVPAQANSHSCYLNGSSYTIEDWDRLVNHLFRVSWYEN